MKPGQSTFDQRLSRINSGKMRNASDVVAPSPRLINTSGKKRSIHFDMLVAGGLAGGVAGVLFEQNLGLLFVLSLEWIAFYGLMLSDYELAAYVAACAIAPVGFVFSLIFSGTAQRGFQFWTFYCIGVLGANHVEVRHVIEFVIIPGFWDYVGTYTSAKDVVNGAVATQPQF